MAERARASLWTLDEYLEHEARAPERHEYRDGYVYAMAGGTAAHSAIAANIIALLRQRRHDGCRVFTSDMLIKLAPAWHSYPDAALSCDSRDLADPFTRVIAHPLLVVEVLSPTTADYDLGDKLAGYQGMASVDYIIYVDGREHAPLRAWQRAADGAWEDMMGPDAGAGGLSPVEIPALYLTITPDAAYADTGL